MYCDNTFFWNITDSGYFESSLALSRNLRMILLVFQIGVWQSYQEENNGLDIKDIVWPGHSHMPPQVVFKISPISP